MDAWSWVGYAKSANLMNSSCQEAVSASQESDWVPRGEGAANVVLGYVGIDPRLTGKVLRLPKNPEHNLLECRALSKLVWFDVPELHCKDRLFRNKHYAQTIIGPKLGLHYIAQQTMVQVPHLISGRDDVEEAGCIHDDCTTTVLQGPACCSGPSFDRTPTISIELKPKCGFITKGRPGQPSPRMPMFILKQRKKLMMGRINSISDYNPLDMFSEDLGRMMNAFSALFTNPQNNLKIFLDGVALRPHAEGFKGGQQEESLKPIVQSLFGKDSRPIWETLGEQLAKLMIDEGILSKLLRLQELDHSGIHVVHSLWQEFRGLSAEELGLLGVSLTNGSLPRTPSATTSRIGALEEYNNCHISPVDLSTAIHFVLSKQEQGKSELASSDTLRWKARSLIKNALSTIQNYLIAATAKDCSLFITLQASANDSNSSRQSCAEAFKSHSSYISKGCNDKDDCSEVKQLVKQSTRSFGCLVPQKSYTYRMWVGDLDFKEIRKISNHFELRKELEELNLSTRTMQTCG